MNFDRSGADVARDDDIGLLHSRADVRFTIPRIGATLPDCKALVATA